MRYFFIIFLFFSIVILPSQYSRGESFTHLTLKDGLSQSSVKCLHQDYQGFIWAGTADGLNKYDGSQFIIYRFNPLNPNSIGGNDISCVYESPYDSVLYIGTQDAGLVIYNRALDNFTSFDKKGKIKSKLPIHITDLLAINDTVLWIASRYNGLFFYNPQDSSFLQAKFSLQDEFRQINCFEKDHQGNLWIGTPNGLYVLGQKNWEKQVPVKVFYNPSASQPVTALQIDIRGNLWIGTRNGGVHKYQPITGRNESLQMPWKDVNTSYVINDIIHTSKNEIWIATNKGLIKYSESFNEFKILTKDKDQESLNNNEIYSIIEDQSGVLWIGTYAGGLNKLDPFQQRFAKFSNFLGLSFQNKTSIYSVHVDNMHRIWLGTSNGLLEMTTNGSGTVLSERDIKHHLKNRNVGAISSTPNNLLISSSGILKVSFDGQIISNLSELIAIQTGEQIYRFTSSFNNGNGNVWLTTDRGLLKYFPDEDLFRLYTPKGTDGAKMSVHLSSITEDYSGKLWLGTYDNQLYSFDIHTEEFKLFLPRDQDKELIVFDKIFSVCELTAGQLFIGTNMGLYAIFPDERIIRRYLADDGLPNNNVYAVVPDNQGGVWCSTNAGLTCFNPTTNTFQSYTYEDGLQSNEFNEGAYFKDKNGIFYMGGIEGLNIFNPENIRRNNYIPPIIITGMEISYKKLTPQSFPHLLGKQVSETKKIVLDRQDNTFSFEFSALSFSLYHRNQYQFTLTEKGEEDNWINAGNRRTATYTNLSPGHYFFKVKGSNSDGVWNEKPASIEVIITPPFWQKWWFRTLLLLFLLGSPLLVVFLRMRNAKMQRLNLQKLVKEKTEQIELQNQKLKAINNNIRQKNQQLKIQHNQIINQRNSMLEMAKEAEKANQAKINLFTNISHEMRTPLTLILGPLKELILKLDVVEKKEIKRTLSNIHFSASKLLTIINQLLEFRKAECGNMQLVVSQTNLVQFTQETASLFYDLAKQKKFNFSFSSSYNNLKIWVDSDKLEKILSNLILNAFKFTPEEGTIEIKVSTIKQQNSVYAVIIIKDTGTGIHVTKLPHIFKEFYQADYHKNPDQPGSGLGLSIASKYVEMHNGKITVTSSFGQGSEFMVMLPFGRKHFNNKVKFDDHVTSDGESMKATICDYLPVNNREYPKFDFKEEITILIIEDDASLRLYLKESLEYKYNIIEAPDAKKGLKLSTTNNINLVICDVFLPDIDGMEVCRKIKSDEKTSHLPVIMLTSAADQAHMTEGLKSGADNYITKPFDLQYLAVSIENLLENRKRIRKKFSLKTPENKHLPERTAKDQRFLNEIIKCVEENLTDSSFNVDSLCSQIGISQSNCYRKIKSLTGSNVSEFIRNVRLKKASELLEQKNYKINEVAYETGFNDPNYFTKCFTKFFGVPPSEYAKL